MSVSRSDTEEMIESMKELQALPAELRVAIAIAKKEGLKEGVREEISFGMSKVIAIMRDVATELEEIMKEFEAEGASS
jgi:hypothetical protein